MNEYLLGFSLVVIFLEMLLKFNLGYYFRGEFEKNRKKILVNYVKGKFIIDIIGRGSILLELLIDEDRNFKVYAVLNLM
jgi:hypothetical protein